MRTEELSARLPTVGRCTAGRPGPPRFPSSRTRGGPWTARPTWARGISPQSSSFLPGPKCCYTRILMLAAIESFGEMLRVERNASRTRRATTRATCASCASFSSTRGPASPTPGRRSTCRASTPPGALLRRLAARGHRKSSVGRKLSTLKTFWRYLRRRRAGRERSHRRRADAEEGEEAATHLTVDDVFRLLETPAADTPAGVRDRAIPGDDLLDRNPRQRLDRLDWDDIDANLEGAARARQGQQGAHRSGRQEGAGSARHLPRRDSLALPAPPLRRAAVFLNRTGTRLTTRSVARLVDGYHPQQRHRHQGDAARPAPQLRHASPRTGRRPARHPGAPGPRQPVDHAEVHAPESRPSDAGVRQGPPACLIPRVSPPLRTLLRAEVTRRVARHHDSRPAPRRGHRSRRRRTGHRRRTVMKARRARCAASTRARWSPASPARPPTP